MEKDKSGGKVRGVNGTKGQKTDRGRIRKGKRKKAGGKDPHPHNADKLQSVGGIK